ncbi:hypothetical protein ACIO1C_24635 [Streptomyces sp. NPDC087420]|uniref:hypothetical protein n=1 Tax=Streptomyces sp. NPDC087420 TaxID=3365785 RepID=UPI0038354A4C
MKAYAGGHPHKQTQPHESQNTAGCSSTPNHERAEPARQGFQIGRPTREFSLVPLQESANPRASDVTTQKMPTARLGDERWSLRMTFTAGGSSSVVKQTAIRTGTTVVLLAGSPALVDAHVNEALTKARFVN